MKGIERKAGEPVKVVGFQCRTEGIIVGIDPVEHANRIRPKTGDERKVSREQAGRRAGLTTMIGRSFPDRRGAIDDAANGKRVASEKKATLSNREICLGDQRRPTQEKNLNGEDSPKTEAIHAVQEELYNLRSNVPEGGP